MRSSDQKIEEWSRALQIPLFYIYFSLHAETPEIPQPECHNSSHRRRRRNKGIRETNNRGEVASYGIILRPVKRGSKVKPGAKQLLRAPFLSGFIFIISFPAGNERKVV